MRIFVYISALAKEANNYERGTVNIYIGEYLRNRRKSQRLVKLT